MDDRKMMREQMFSQIELWHQSGLTQKAFCEEQSIRYHVFQYWHGLYRNKKVDANKNGTSFVRVELSKAIGASVEIHLQNGVRLYFHEPVSSAYIKALVH